jgi:hypothetical protein
LAAHISSYPGLRVPGCWNGFELATRAILGQQTGTERANALAGRMVRAFGQPFCPAKGLTHLFPTSEVLANSDLESIGLPRPQADAIRALVRAVRNGQIASKKWWTPMPFSCGSQKFPELENRQHNGWPHATFGSRTRFHPLIAILRARSRWAVPVNLSIARWLGARGELTRPYISGPSPVKSGRSEMQPLPEPRKQAAAVKIQPRVAVIVRRASQQ